MSNHPERISPWRVMTELDEPFRIAEGPFTLAGSKTGDLTSGLNFYWRPDLRFAVEGEFSERLLKIGDSAWHLRGEIHNQVVEAPLFLTHVRTGLSENLTLIRGFVSAPIELGADGPFDVLRFSLVNFPDYPGAAIQDTSKSLTYAGRLALPFSQGEIRVDQIHEVKELHKQAAREGGFVITHVGEFIPAAGHVMSEQAVKLLALLHNWFGFCRGAWTGPVFPQGLRGDEVVWEHLASWRLDEGRAVPSWLPDRHPIDLQEAFGGFARLWENDEWREPLATAIAWYVEANARRTAHETRVILAQVALEMLAYVVAVETERLHARSDFDHLSAAGRIRTLLQVLDIPAPVPAHFVEVQRLVTDEVFDGPGLITFVRNKLIHATAKSRAAVAAVSGVQRWECGQLALQYLELVLLALLGHNGRYAQRAWRGWKGDDEIYVPWRQTA